MEAVSDISKENWLEFLAKFGNADLSFTPEWKHFLEKTFDFEAKYIFIVDDNDIVSGILPLFKAKNLTRSYKLCSSPFSQDCGYIGSPNLKDIAIEKAINTCKNISYIEVRSAVNRKDFIIRNDFSTFYLKLSSDIDEIWKKLEQNSVRWAINASSKRGVSVFRSKNIEDLKEFYQLNCIVKKDIGVPCHPWAFFKNMFEIINNNSLLYLSKYKNDIIGGGIMNFYKNTITYGYGAANPGSLKLYPYNAFIWKSIEDACSNGFEYYDFGRVSYDNIGLIKFKKRWGTEERKLFYSFYPYSPDRITENRDNFKYKYATNLIRKIPLKVYTKISDITFKYFN